MSRINKTAARPDEIAKIDHGRTIRKSETGALKQSESKRPEASRTRGVGPDAIGSTHKRASSSIETGRILKSDQILKLLRRKQGASLAEMQSATGWQPHSVRGFLSGAVKKRLGLKLSSSVARNGERRYAIVTR